MSKNQIGKCPICNKTNELITRDIPEFECSLNGQKYLFKEFKNVKICPECNKRVNSLIAKSKLGYIHAIITETVQ